MIKPIIFLSFLFVSTLTYANAEHGTDKIEKKEAKQSANTTDQVKPKSLTTILAVELPEAVLRLHDLEKKEYNGTVIYAHVPLELAKIKSPVKTV